jgi:hypothetical protein
MLGDGTPHADDGHPRLPVTSRSRSNIDADKEATTLVVILTGMASSVLANIHTTEQAGAILDYQLDRLFPPSPNRRRP